MKNKLDSSTNIAGLYTLAIRWVIGWTYFSAFWRRLILDNKLIPDEAGYIGEKFNHFLPNALVIKPLITYLVTHPDALQVAMIAFTLIEAIVGLCMILGLFTRLMSIGVILLATGILLGSGWLGTTCLDEWQIGVLGIAGGCTIFLTGSSQYAVDQHLINKNVSFTKTKWFNYLGSGILKIKKLHQFSLVTALLIFALTLYTNQYFHGGVFGTLHNKSVKPKIEISDIMVKNDSLEFQLYRTEGADVYGSFVIGIQLLDQNDDILTQLDQEALSKYPLQNIKNHYIAKIKPGKHSLIVPLGAKAILSLNVDPKIINNIRYVKLIDISGIEWISAIK